jgi:hypothetical protein
MRSMKARSWPAATVWLVSVISSAMVFSTSLLRRDSGTAAANLSRFDARPAAAGQAVIDDRTEAAAMMRTAIPRKVPIS